MTRKDTVVTARNGSHASTGADSWKSADTVKAILPKVETPKKMSAEKRAQLEKDNQISPHTVMTPPSANDRINVAPWESAPSSAQSQLKYNDIAPWESGPPSNNSQPQRRELAPWESTPTPDGSRNDVAPWGDPPTSDVRKESTVHGLVSNPSKVPTILHAPPSATDTSPPILKDPTPQYGRHNRPSHLPSSIFGNNFYDSNDDLPQMSPGFRSLNGDNNLKLQDDRRPSVASTTSFSSTNSKRSAVSAKYKKKLQGFFGEDYEKMGERQNSDGSLQNSIPASAHASFMERKGSTPGYRPSSPASSRPKTPQASSEVTPWVFQDSADVPHPPELKQPEPIVGRTPKSSVSHHRLHLPGHRTKGSNEESQSRIPSQAQLQRPGTTSREPAASSLREAHGSVSSVSTVSTLRQPRSSSPTPSMGSLQSRDTLSTRSPADTHTSKRSIFARVTGRNKVDKGSPDNSTLKTLPSSTGSFAPTARSGNRPDFQLNLQNPKQRKGTFAEIRPMSKKDRLLSKSSKRSEPSAEVKSAKEPNAVRANSALWHLDTNMSDMEGIIDANQPMMTPPINPSMEVGGGFPWDGNQKQLPIEDLGAGAWEVPDSWAVKRVADQNIARLGEIDEVEGLPNDDDPGPMYFMRIFRADSTFAVISAGINTTSAELINMMAKKTFLQDELDTYQIVMKKRGLSRQLDPGERPLVIQNRLLEMAGYQQSDKLEDVGREDHGYLCRFTFLPNKMGGYSSLEKDPGFSKMQKFNHIDLAGRNLVTIPITLYQKAGEIITLNLSQNLSLDIPKDFMQSCVNLREIKYTSNEAWKLPTSFSMAAKLTMVDFSNNRLEQLEHAELDRLGGLISLKLSNNKLSTLPLYMGSYQALRSLNLASNMLTEFPDFLGKLRTLVDLDVSFNSISSLPSVGKLVNLERLFATNNKLSGAFPEDFKDLVNLNSLDIRFNSIDNIDVMSQLPKLEHLMVGHNSISAFEGTFQRLKLLFLDHNPVTRFGLSTPVPTLSVLNIASAKLAQLPEDLFLKLSGLTKLTLNKNHLVSLSSQIGRMTKLEHLSVAKNLLGKLPAEIGHLICLRYLDVRENNIDRLPSEIWYAKRLESLNVSANVLVDFPKPGNPPPAMAGDHADITPVSTPSGLSASPDFDELGKLEGFQLRRGSHVSAGHMNGATSPGANLRKGSTATVYNTSRNPSLTARSSTESNLGTITPSTRKDSTLSSKLAQTFAPSLRHLILADNRLTDDVFDELVMLPELRTLNLSYNELYDMPSRTIKRWPNLTDLFLSGNDLTSLPAEDLEEGSALRILHLNGNKFQVLPAELGKIQKLQTLDVASNSLKYNVSNWPYDWNWNWNHQLRYLNMSGNKRLEIKPNANAMAGRGETRDLTDFSTLVNLRVLGLMDVTLTIPSVPDQGPDRRVRTAGSTIGTSIPYGVADTLGRHEHLSTLDMVIPAFGGHEDQTVFGIFDGQTLSSGGSKIAKYLHEKFRHYFLDELEKIRNNPAETPCDALRRSFLGLNKDLASAATQALDVHESPSNALVHRGSVSGLELGDDDLNSGAVATVMYLHGTELFVSNVGDAQAVLIQSEGGHRFITRKHDPAEAGERQRIREAGGFVSRQGKLNDVLEVSRAFGYVQMTPCIIAAPHVSQISLKESDEIILLASRELWEYLTPDFAVDVARSERNDLMRAAQKLRDLAIAFGATSKIMVMMVGVSDLRKRERARFRTHSMSMGPSGTPDDYFTTARRTKRGRDTVGDSKLARLDQEVDAPEGEVTLVFTDIKNSTMLWETFPVPMRSAIKMHNELMRRHLRIIGGYEVKTEGDAFMVSFPTVTSALLWCFTIQSQLLEVQWPQEILNSVHGSEVLDPDGNIIFKGLSVRMGIHWGHPVCELDPVTKRMDYFGPMVNRAARISSVADGGQITVSSDFIAEIQRLLETHIESDRSTSTGSEETLSDDLMSQAIRRELRSLSSQGFEVKDLGNRTLKGLENPEYIYLMYPHSLASRLVVQQQRAEAAEAAAVSTAPTQGQGTKARDSQLTIDTDNVWDLWNISLRLEMLCSSLECSGITQLKPPELALLEQMKSNGGEVTDRFLVNFVEHQISRIETCITTLTLRHMVRPFRQNMLQDACPITEIMSELAGRMQELQMYKEAADFTMAPS